MNMDLAAVLSFLAIPKDLESSTFVQSALVNREWDLKRLFILPNYNNKPQGVIILSS
jgi:hypothetical protein